MAVVFEATIKMEDTDNWYIELKDIVDGRVENCLSLDELETKIEEFGQDYGGHVDEVKWLKDDDILPPILDDVRLKMAEHKKKIEDLTGETIEETSKSLQK